MTWSPLRAVVWLAALLSGGAWSCARPAASPSSSRHGATAAGSSTAPQATTSGEAATGTTGAAQTGGIAPGGITPGDAAPPVGANPVQQPATLAPRASYQLPTSVFGVWSLVPWCSMVARGRYDSRVLVREHHVSFSGCNALGTECVVEPPAIHCTRSRWGLKRCFGEDLARDRRARRYTDLVMSAATLQIEGRELVFYAADGSKLFALHQYVEQEACEPLEGETGRSKVSR